MTSDSKTELASRLCGRYDEMKSRRAVWDTFWQEIAEYVMPRKAQITERESDPDSWRNDQLFDSTAIRSNQILANGQLAWMTPMEERWFAFQPPRQAQSDDAKRYFQMCTEIAQEELARSNFYTEIHELYLDRGAFGTALLYCEEGKRSALRFHNHDVGCYTAEEDDEGYVDTVFREFRMSVRAAAGKFGEQNLSEGLRKKLTEDHDPERQSGGGKGQDERVTFLHCVYPRPERERAAGRMDGANKPVASVYLEAATRHVVQVSGYNEMPYAVTRYLKWGDSPYGWSPSWMALPESRQLNFLEMNMDALAEIQAFPRILCPDTLEGDVEFQAGGITYFDSNNPNAMPKEWATAGRYDVGLNRAEHRRMAIEQAFHVDLFQMFSTLNKPMTAREVAERSAEKLTQFSPTFARMTTELLNPVLRRVFGLLARAGAFPPPPPAVLFQNGEEFELLEPEVTYSSRIALAIKSLQNTAWARTLETTLPLMDRDPAVLDNFNLDLIVRDTSRNEGLPAEWMRSQAEVEELRAGRAQQEAAAQQMAMAGEAASAAQKVGSIPPENLQALGGLLGGGGGGAGLPQG